MRPQMPWEFSSAALGASRAPVPSSASTLTQRTPGLKLFPPQGVLGSYELPRDLHQMPTKSFSFHEVP